MFDRDLFKVRSNAFCFVLNSSITHTGHLNLKICPLTFTPRRVRRRWPRVGHIGRARSLGNKLWCVHYPSDVKIECLLVFSALAFELIPISPAGKRLPQVFRVYFLALVVVMVPSRRQTRREWVTGEVQAETTITVRTPFNDLGSVLIRTS